MTTFKENVKEPVPLTTHDWIAGEKNGKNTVLRKYPKKKDPNHKQEPTKEEINLVEEIKKGSRNGKYRLPAWIS